MVDEPPAGRAVEEESSPPLPVVDPLPAGRVLEARLRSLCALARERYNKIVRGKIGPGGKIYAPTLSFIDEDVERGFAKSQMERKIGSLRFCIFVTFALALYTGMVEYCSDRGDRRDSQELRAAWILGMCSLVVSALLVIVMLTAALVIWRRAREHVQIMEGILVCMILILQVGLCASTKHYASRIIGVEDTGALWGLQLESTDGALLIYSSSAILTAHAILPIRWRYLVPMEVLILVVYLLFVAFLGSADARVFPFLLGGFVSLIVLASHGKRDLELQERLLFLALLKERRLRSEAEFQLSQKVVPKKQGGPGSVLSSRAATEAFADPGGATFDKLVELGQKEQWLLDASEVQLLPAKPLGKGGYGIVAKGAYQGVEVAIKAPCGSREKDTQRQSARGQELCNELRILRRLHHPNIVFLYGAVIKPAANGVKVCLVLELVHGLPLAQAVSTLEGSECEEAARVELMLDIASALHYLHSQHPVIVHGDLKDHNIFVERRHNRGLKAKLLDFGLSRLVTREAKSLGGTRRWAAPEVLEGACFPNKAADVFSFGRLVFLITTDQVPYAGFRGRDLDKLIRKCSQLNWPEGDMSELSLLTRPLVSSCTRQAAEQRPPIQDVHRALSRFGAEIGSKAVSATSSFSVPTGSSSSTGPRDGAELRAFDCFGFQLLTARERSEPANGLPKARTPSPLRTSCKFGRGTSSCGSLANGLMTATPPETQLESVVSLLSQWQPTRSRMCCPTHSCLARLRNILQELSTAPCSELDALRLPACGQCQECGLLHLQGFADRECHLCGTSAHPSKLRL